MTADWKANKEENANSYAHYYYEYLQESDRLLEWKKEHHLILHEEDEDYLDLLYSNQFTYLKELQEKLKQGLLQKQSSSMILIGDQYEGKKLVLSSIHRIVQEMLFPSSPSSPSPSLSSSSGLLPLTRAEASITNAKAATTTGTLTFQDIQQHLIFIDGQTIQSDQEAFLTLSNQCLLRQHSLFYQNHDKNITALIEDLEAYFHQCRINDFPAIIMIDSFHIFTRYKRQTFLYTLLDFIHKADLLFVVIGLTQQVDIYMKLEKRVLSRLNSQYYYVKQYPVEQLAQYMLVKLLLSQPLSSSSSSSSSIKALSSSTTKAMKAVHDQPIGLIEIEEMKKYRKQFNDQLSQLFGVFILNPKGNIPTKTNSMNDLPFLHTIEEKQTFNFHQYHIELSRPGTAFHLLQMMLDWGKNLEYFDGVIHRLTLSISPRQPYITLQVLQTESPSLAELLSSLSASEKQIYAVIARIQCQQVANHYDQLFSSTTNPNATANSNTTLRSTQQHIANHYNNTLPTDGKREITVQQVLNDFDRLTGSLSNKVLSVNVVLNMIVQLANYGLIQLWASAGFRNQPLQSSARVGDINELMDAKTIITTYHTQYEIIAAFRIASDGGDPIYSWKQVSPLTNVVIPEKFRRAVLEPMKPIIIERII